MSWKKLITLVLHSCISFNNNTVAIEEGTWTEAVQTCRVQNTAIASNVTALKYYYSGTNDRFWLSKAVYKTPWIDNLGCFSFDTSVLVYESPVYITLGDCQQNCQKKNMSYFTFQLKTCACLSYFDPHSRSVTRSSSCDYNIYKTLSMQYTSSYDCMTTTCIPVGTSAGKSVYRKTYEPSNCDSNFDVNSGCSTGETFGYGLSQNAALNKCTSAKGFLPGYNDKFCETVINNQGWLTSKLWSSIIRTKYRKIFNLTARIPDEKPVRCTSGYFSDTTGDIVEEDVDCDISLKYMCESLADTSDSPSSLENNSTDVIVGVVVGFIFVISAVIVCILVSKLRHYGPFKKNSNVNESGEIHRNSTEMNTDVDQTENAFVPEKQISHFPGRLTNDDYAVVDKTFNSNTKSPQINSTGPGLLYRKSTEEYDILHNTRLSETNNPKNLYDISIHFNTLAESGYHSANNNPTRHRVSHDLEHYDHISSENNKINLEYALPV